MEITSTNNPEKHDEYNVVVTPVGSGDASIYFVVTDSFGESIGELIPDATDATMLVPVAQTFFPVKVNHVPVANGGQETNPRTLGDIAIAQIAAYRNLTIGDVPPDLDLVDSDDSGDDAYFSDGDGDALLCRFNMSGDSIFGEITDTNRPVVPDWTSGGDRQVIGFSDLTGGVVKRGTAMFDVWCWDRVGTPVADFEQSPTATLTISVTSDRSVQ